MDSRKEVATGSKMEWGQKSSVTRQRDRWEKVRNVPGTNDGKVIFDTLVVDVRVLVERRHGNFGSTNVSGGSREGAREARGTKPSSTN